MPNSSGNAKSTAFFCWTICSTTPGSEGYGVIYFLRIRWLESFLRGDLLTCVRRYFRRKSRLLLALVLIIRDSREYRIGYLLERFIQRGR